MSVYVTLLPATVPHRFRDEDVSRTQEFKDRSGENAAVFQFSLDPSGALIIWRVTAGVRADVETIYGPASWEDVQGDLHKSL